MIINSLETQNWVPSISENYILRSKVHKFTPNRAKGSIFALVWNFPPTTLTNIRCVETQDEVSILHFWKLPLLPEARRLMTEQPSPSIHCLWKQQLHFQCKQRRRVTLLAIRYKVFGWISEVCSGALSQGTHVAKKPCHVQGRFQVKKSMINVDHGLYHDL